MHKNFNEDVNMLHTLDGDWYQAFSILDNPSKAFPTLTVSEDPFTINDVLRVIGESSYSPEGYGSWEGVCVVLLRDGRFAAVSAQCDTTGWG